MLALAPGPEEGGNVVATVAQNVCLAAVAVLDSGGEGNGLRGLLSVPEYNMMNATIIACASTTDYDEDNAEQILGDARVLNELAAMDRTLQLAQAGANVDGGIL